MKSLEVHFQELSKLQINVHICRLQVITESIGTYIRELEECEITSKLIVNSHCCKDPESILPKKLIPQVFQHAQIESKSSLILSCVVLAFQQPASHC